MASGCMNPQIATGSAKNLWSRFTPALFLPSFASPRLHQHQPAPASRSIMILSPKWIVFHSALTTVPFLLSPSHDLPHFRCCKKAKDDGSHAPNGVTGKASPSASSDHSSVHRTHEQPSVPPASSD